MNSYLIKNATIVNEGSSFVGDVLIENGVIKKVDSSITTSTMTVIDASGKYLIPGLIDDQVHFREPGLTHKATIGSESRAAVAGGITTFIEMPNTVPQATNQQLLQDKFNIAEKTSYANYSFMMGGTNDNDNLQVFCKKCHFDKTKNEQEHGYVRVSDTESSFNMKTHELFNSSLCGAYAFVESFIKPQGENYTYQGEIVNPENPLDTIQGGDLCKKTLRVTGDWIGEAKWEDINGNVLGYGNYLIVSPTVKTKYIVTGWYRYISE